MLFKKWLLAVLVLIQIISLSGCWDYRDINKVAFPQLGAYDLHQENNTSASSILQEYKRVDLTVEVPNLVPEAKEKARIEKTSGIMIANARAQKTYSGPTEYSPAVAGVIIFGEDLAATGINKYVEALARGPKNPHTVNFAVAEGRAENILRVPVKDYPDMGSYLRPLLRSSDQKGFFPATTLHQFDTNQNPGKNPIMPILMIKDGKVMYGGVAIFRKDQVIAKATLEEAPYLMMLRGIKTTGNLPFELIKDGMVADTGSVNIKNSRKVKVDRTDDEFTFTIKIDIKAQLAEHSSPVRFTEDKNLRKEIEGKLQSDIQNGSNRLVKKMQREYKLDCIDISKYALAKWRKELEGKIDQGFIENVNIKVDVKVEIRNVGELS